MYIHTQFVVALYVTSVDSIHLIAYTFWLLKPYIA